MRVSDIHMPAVNRHPAPRRKFALQSDTRGIQQNPRVFSYLYAQSIQRAEIKYLSRNCALRDGVYCGKIPTGVYP